MRAILGEGKARRRREPNPRALLRGRGGDGLEVVGGRESSDEEESGEGEQSHRRRAEDGEKVEPVAHG